MTASPTSKYAVSFVFITVLLDMVGFGMIIPVQPAIIQQVSKVDLAAAAFIGGWMFFAFSATQFLFGPMLGNLSDAYGRRPLLLIAGFGLGVDFLIAVIIFLASIYLGWHYAVDGCAAFGLALLCWWGAGPIAKFLHQQESIKRFNPELMTLERDE